jgi:hypothetical protein
MKPLLLPLFPKDTELITLCGGAVLIIFICVVRVLSETGNTLTVCKEKSSKVFGSKMRLIY